MVIRIIRTSMFVIALMSASVSLHAEYFKGGYPACISEQKLKEFLAKKTGGERYQYIAANWCIYPKAGYSIKVVSITPGDYVEVEFTMGSQRVKLWAPSLAVVRRKQPPLQNIILSPENPSGEQLCALISMNTSKYNKEAEAVASDIVDLQNRLSSKLKTQYSQGITGRSYELVVNWTATECVAELDFLNLTNLGCSVDVQKFNRCRGVATGANRPIATQCFNDLCIKPVRVENYP